MDRIDYSPKKRTFLESLEEEDFLGLCFAASFIGAYLAGLAAAYGLAAWEFSAASTIKPLVLDTLALPFRRWNGSITEFAANTVFWLILLAICLVISTLWVKPIAGTSSRLRRTRLIAAGSAGALASLSLFILWSRFEEGKHRKGYDNARCQQNLKQISMAFLFDSSERPESVLSELSSIPGTLAPKDGVLNPEYLEDISLLHCPAWNLNKSWYQPPKPKNVTMEDDRSYFYLGYRIPDQATLKQFADAYRKRAESGKPFDVDMPLTASDGVVPRLRGRESADHASRIPIMIERYPNRHDPASGNVLYLDGHIERVKWGEKWPMTPEAMDVLLALDALGSE
jgi:prepilin-type processing-associated H-X9-DG protein